MTTIATAERAALDERAERQLRNMRALLGPIYDNRRALSIVMEQKVERWSDDAAAHDDRHGAAALQAARRAHAAALAYRNTFSEEEESEARDLLCQAMKDLCRQETAADAARAC